MSTTELRAEIVQQLENVSDEQVLKELLDILVAASRDKRLSEVMTSRVAEAQAEYKAGLGSPVNVVLKRIREDLGL